MRPSLIILLTTLSLSDVAAADTFSQAPGQPVDPAHPGSSVYDYKFEISNIRCGDRDVAVYLPTAKVPGEMFSAVVYGHGQALGVSAYDATLRHLAGKGVAALFPTYDNGFFDQNWQRMGSDYVRLTECALSQMPALDKSKIVYSGHSKGAHIASIAACLAARASSVAAPKALVVFETAGLDLNSLRDSDPRLITTVIFGDSDTTVDRKFSQDLFDKSPSRQKQFITVASYRSSPSVKADHMWPLTKGSFVGGQDPTALHYYGAWKWLIAAAQDLDSVSPGTHPHLYGDQAADKGDGSRDTIQQSW